MLTKHDYCPLPDDWVDDIASCCPDKPADDPGGSDCCYDAWNNQLISVNRNFRQIDERARRYQRQLDSAITFRDKYKGWFEDLLKANDLAGYICQHMQVFAAQVNNICCTTQSGVDAVNLLFCMARDFYIRVDDLKEEYDRLINCIKCLGRPELNGGIIDCLTAYNTKLEAAILTRDKIIELLVKAVKLAYEVNSSICSRYGLQRTISEWQETFNCGGGDEGEEQYKGKYKPGKDDGCECMDEDCDLVPVLTFPLENDSYFSLLQNERTRWDKRIREIQAKLLVANKEKEVLLANKENLVKAIQEVDPKNKCK